MPPFFRFPHTPHLAWLGSGAPRDDKVLSAGEAAALLNQDLVVEEKVDGANLGLSVSEDGELLAQNRGTWLERGSAHPQFRPLWPWLTQHQQALTDALWPTLILFGEWCHAVHSTRYDRLPDWFLGFDVYDRELGSFWDSERRNVLLSALALHPVPRIGRGSYDLRSLTAELGESALGSAPREGLVVRHESGGKTIRRAKLVRPSFMQAIDTHWSKGPLETNGLARQDP